MQKDERQSKHYNNLNRQDAKNAKKRLRENDPSNAIAQ